jgi:hypothetical protein
MLLNLRGSRSAQLISKIMGFLISLTGIFLVAKYQLYLTGIILLVIGIYFAALLGTRDLQ